METPLIAPLQRFRNEVYTSSFLRRRDVDIVPIVGVYSTEAHPFGLVYEYMDGLDLRQFLRNEPNAGRLKLVLPPILARSLLFNTYSSCQQLLKIAQTLDRMHDLGILHGNLQTVHPSPIHTFTSRSTLALSRRKTSWSTGAASPE